MKRVLLWLAVVVLALIMVAPALAEATPTAPSPAAPAAPAAKGHPGGCASCHVAHDSQGARLWPYAPNAKTEKGTPLSLGSALCYSCHDGTITAMGASFFDKDGSTHPIDVKPSVRCVVPKDFPVDDQGNITCASCHDPHNKGGKALASYLRMPSDDGTLCTACHVNN
jgi:predicted CXXCH cytochrome family protein